MYIGTVSILCEMCSPTTKADNESTPSKVPSARGGTTHLGGANGLELVLVDGFRPTPKALENEERRRGGEGGSLGDDCASLEKIAPACEDDEEGRGDETPSLNEEERT